MVEPLAADEVHVWRAPLDLPAPALLRLQDTLTADERARAAAYRFRWDHDRFTAARGWLRWVLGRYAGTPAGHLRFQVGEGGKPALSGRAGESLRFNLSHSDGLALVAISPGREVGVDLELVRDEFPGMETARRFFSAGEVAALEALPQGSRARAFFDCWSRKEAYMKACGVGLALALDRFEVTFGPGRPPELHSAGWARGEPGPDEAQMRLWTLHALDAGPAYAAALVLAGGPARVRNFNCEPGRLLSAD
jgi:4'-phosphopantetheinyl transferase